MPQPLPAVFFGHGTPMNAVSTNPYTTAWAALGARLPRPAAVLAVSAHWYIPATAVTAMAAPRTIHDFGGFPPELYQIDYPAPGDPALARRVQALLAPVSVTLDTDWGLDHGTWSVLRHVFPHADIPVVQLSIGATQPPAFHYELGRRLAPLREDGVFILGSGNVVHNLQAYAWGRRPVEPFAWAVRFETQVQERLRRGEIAALVEYDTLGRDARLSIPTPDHYLPLLYVMALQREGEPIHFPVDGIEGGSVSMLAVQVG